MSSLFPIADEPGQAPPGGAPVQPGPPMSEAGVAVHQNYTSFNAAAFLSQQQQPSSVQHDGLRGAHSCLAGVALLGYHGRTACCVAAVRRGSVHAWLIAAHASLVLSKRSARQSTIKIGAS